MCIRDSFIARLVQRAGWDCPTEPNPFSDVGPDHWAADAINCIYWLEITDGKTADTYAPDEPVTRAQMATFIARLWTTLA